MQIGRQLLISDLAATILTNFLAVFLAIAAKSFYNIARRILRFRILHRQNNTQNVEASSNGTSGSDDCPAVSTASTSQTTAFEQSDSSVAGTSRADNITRLGDPTAAAESQGILTHRSDQTRFERLEVIDKAHDPETLGITTLTRFLFGLWRSVPIRSFNGNRPIHCRMLATEFWSNMFKIAGENSGDLLWNFFIASGAFVLYFGSMLLSIMSAYPVVGDSVAVSQHPRCSLVTTNGTQDNDPYSFALGGRYYSDIARESRQYAKSCYSLGRSTSDAPGPDSCSFFYKPSIDYTIIDNDVCPFRTAGTHMCLGGENSAYTVATGSPNSVLTVDASTIGINSPLQYKFHRSITCSPLMTEDLILPFDSNGTLGFRYLYGSRTGEHNCTTDQPRCTFEIMVYPDANNRAYNMFTQSTRRLGPRKWHPIFEVNESLGETATLMLMSNFVISYPRESLDPVFPARTNSGNGWYYSTQFHASVLGCVSRTLVCLHKKALGPCYDLVAPGNLDELDPEDTSVRAMLYFSLLADLGEQLGYLQGDALEVQSLLTGSISSKISNNQWKVEVRQMFEALLARTQINARNIARGVPGQELPNQQSLMRPEYQGMCTRYKFRAIGWKNISINHFVVEISIGLMICILGVTRENKELWFEELIRRVLKSWLGRTCVSAVMRLVDTLVFCASRVWKGLCWLGGLCSSFVCAVGKGAAMITRLTYDVCRG